MFRWAAWAWMATVLVLGRDHLRPERAPLAAGLVLLALAVTALGTVLLRRRPDLVTTTATVTLELAVGVSLVVCDGVVYEPGHAFATQQSLGVAWPLFGVLSAGVAFGPGLGAASGVAVGGARLAGTLANGVVLGDITGGRIASHFTTVIVYTLAGSMVGYVTGLLRQAEAEISAARAREEVTRTLHDGVLQTLAIVERRATDPDLARLARQQERDLREWLFGTVAARGNEELGPALRAAAARFEDGFGGRAEVIVADDVGAITGTRRAALAGAVGEALVNAGKHGGASRVTVYVEPDPATAGSAGVFCSVKDDGIGFDPTATPEGVGLSRSIRARIEEVGGRVEIASSPGRGTDVRVWLP